MKIPLLFEARPQDANASTFCFLPGGEWKITSTKVDSEFSILTRDGNKKQDIIIGPAFVQAKLTKIGTEKSLSIFAERI